MSKDERRGYTISLRENEDGSWETLVQAEMIRPPTHLSSTKVTVVSQGTVPSVPSIFEAFDAAKGKVLEHFQKQTG